MKIKFSQSFEAKRSRIRRLPELGDQICDGAIKCDMIAINKTFQDGIRNDTFSLRRLAEITKLQKKQAGYTKPSHPLYGAGDTEKNSYINMMRIKKIGKTKWKLFPSWAKHHKSKLKLRELFAIHEHGAIIKHGKSMIKIPPRPAFEYAYNRYMNDKRISEIAKEIRNAITDYINNGKNKLVEIYLNYSSRVYKEEQD